MSAEPIAVAKSVALDIAMGAALRASSSPSSSPSSAPITLPYEGFDWMAPDYSRVLSVRAQRLIAIRANPLQLPIIKLFYKNNPIQFIIDWGITVDPRNIEIGGIALIPFILFPKQVEALEWILSHWRGRRPGLMEKSRESGVSWLTVALGCALCIFNKDMVIGYGSRKEEYVDKLGVPKSLFEKGRIFMENLPIEFLTCIKTGIVWRRDRHSPHMRIIFPMSGAVMTGEAGDGIGRGDRTSLYIVDESAFIERAQLVDASLASTTNCRIDVSTPAGMNNVFGQKRMAGRIDVFTFHWRDDPRKDEAWYEKQKAELDPVTLAQEVDISYTASVDNVLIPAAWVNAAVDAHIKLGIPITGQRRGALDIADKGIDKNALTLRHGILVEDCFEWSGRESDTYYTVTFTINRCEEFGCTVFDYDADGIGALVRGDTRNINEERQKAGRPQIGCFPFQSSGKVYQPEACMVPRRKNKDYFANAKAQAWWSLRLRFQETYRAVVEKAHYDPDKIISINSKIKNLGTLLMELSQPTYGQTATGKIIVNKQPEGTRSPNKADSVNIAYSPSGRAWEAWARLAR